MANDIASTEAVEQLIRDAGYVTEDEITTAIYLAIKLRRPLLVEGFAGVGKTEIAKVLAAQAEHWGAPLANHLVYARRPDLFRAVRGMYTEHVQA